MNIPQNKSIASSNDEPEATTRIIKNVVLNSPISTYINNLSPYRKNAQTNFINQNNMINQLGYNNYHKNSSSMFQINNLYNKNCKTCYK